MEEATMLLIWRKTSERLMADKTAGKYGIDIHPSNSIWMPKITIVLKYFKELPFPNHHFLVSIFQGATFFSN